MEVILQFTILVLKYSIAVHVCSSAIFRADFGSKILFLKPMACNFSIPFSGRPDEVLSKARSAVQSQGGNFEGDATTGVFGVTVFGNTIKGSYTVDGQNLVIVIDTKPFFVPCSTIEGYLKSQISV